MCARMALRSGHCFGVVAQTRSIATSCCSARWADRSGCASTCRAEGRVQCGGVVNGRGGGPIAVNSSSTSGSCWAVCRGHRGWRAISWANRLDSVRSLATTCAAWSRRQPVHSFIAKGASLAVVCPRCLLRPPYLGTFCRGWHDGPAATKSESFVSSVSSVSSG